MSVFPEISAFLEMGGYGAFVWPAYGVTAAVMIGIALWAWRAQRAARARVARLEALARDGDAR